MHKPAGLVPLTAEVLSSAAERIDLICEQFAMAWRRGKRPSIEETLVGVDLAMRGPLLLRLLTVELIARRQISEPVESSEYLHRFPDASSVVRAVWEAASLDDNQMVAEEPGRVTSLPTVDLLALWSELFTAPTSDSAQPTQPSVPALEPIKPRLAVAAELVKPHDPILGPAPAGYEWIRPLGQGGMGVVWMARQVQLNRIVALKMILHQERVDSRNLDRFLAEAEAMAAIKHPHVVQIYESGEATGRPFLAMEYLSGGSLADRIGQGSRLEPIDAARLIATLAGAVQAAHDLGIIHRDLKPGNVLYDLAGQPRIADFGLAKWSGRADLTTSRAVMGTPAYMAPEQARGNTRFVGPGADIYALGSILYECLTGTRPFQATDQLFLLRAVIEQDPELPSRRIKGLPRDIELICLKCLAKVPADRYASASALAADLDCFAAGQAVSVRPAGKLERSIRWVRRQPTLAVAYGLTVAVVILLGFGASLGTLWQVAAHAQVAERAARTSAELALAEARRARAEAEQTRDKLAHSEYGRAMQVAHQEWLDGSPDVTRSLLDGTRADLRGWEWDFVNRLCHTELRELKGHRHVLTAVAFNPDGSRIASASWDRSVKIWDAQTGRELLSLRGHTDGIAALAWSPDGTRIATAGRDSTARIWNPDTGVEILSLRGHSARVEALSWSPDGQRIATASADRTARIWHAESAALIRTLLGHTGAVSGLAWSPDGKWVATASQDRRARIWNATDGSPIVDFEGHLGGVTALAWSPDGRRIASAGKDATARVWLAATGVEVLVLKGHMRAVSSVAWNPDGTMIATGSDDATMKVWDGRTAAEIRTFRGHLRVVTAVSWSRDGLQIVSSSHDATARVWLVAGPSEALPLIGHTNIIHAVAWSRDGRQVATASDDGTARIWNTWTGVETHALTGHNGPVYVTSWNPDGSRIATAGTDGTARVWDTTVPGGRELFAFRGHKEGVLSVAWSPDGSRIATSSRDRTAKVWEAATGTEIQTLTGHAEPILSVNWNHDGTRIATACADGTARIWDAKFGSVLQTLQGHAGILHMVSWSPDGARVATASRDGTARVWDASTGAEIFALKGHAGALFSVSWSPDGQRIATASDDDTARIWDARTGTENLTLKGHHSYLRSVSWSPDGARLATASDDTTARLWGFPTNPAP